MIKKFEIKSHDGPGRIGKIDNNLTPKLFYKNQIKIAPNQGSAYNIDREIAEFNVKETLRLATENVEECDIAVIQGSKYIDLRIECLKKLEEIGYNGFIIANSDALLTNPRDLVDLIVSLKKEASKSSYFIF
jgi:tRNA-guanine family transglycosylase